ncbi:MAG TPA: response regulator transcription factor [Blastocatellia bacterium]|nr:response regulator transcription factor [Blastocatellia bacterium]
MGKRILLVEDEPGVALTLTDRLASERYEVDVAEDGLAGLRKALAAGYDLILLDIMLPGKGGFEVCREIRQSGVMTPILMLTARDHTAEKVLGLKLGADDYVVKPFDMLELLARIEALLRRAAARQSAPQTVVFGSVQVDIDKVEVLREGEPVDLSAQEFKLLQYFVEHQQVVLSRNILLDEVWGYDAIPSTRTVDVHVAGLRQKLEPDPRRPRHIITVHRLGYKFVP